MADRDLGPKTYDSDWLQRAERAAERLDNPDWVPAGWTKAEMDDLRATPEAKEQEFVRQLAGKDAGAGLPERDLQPLMDRGDLNHGDTTRLASSYQEAHYEKEQDLYWLRYETQKSAAHLEDRDWVPQGWTREEMDAFKAVEPGSFEERRLSFQLGEDDAGKRLATRDPEPFIDKAFLNDSGASARSAYLGGYWEKESQLDVGLQPTDEYGVPNHMPNMSLEDTPPGDARLAVIGRDGRDDHAWGWNRSELDDIRWATTMISMPGQNRSQMESDITALHDKMRDLAERDALKGHERDPNPFGYERPSAGELGEKERALFSMAQVYSDKLNELQPQRELSSKDLAERFEASPAMPGQQYSGRVVGENDTHFVLNDEKGNNSLHSRADFHNSTSWVKEGQWAEASYSVGGLATGHRGQSQIESQGLQMGHERQEKEAAADFSHSR